jgi:hypothetical protein
MVNRDIKTVSGGLLHGRKTQQNLDGNADFGHLVMK